ncbi:hypothetical protein ACLB2K_065355 [Fragaria x ananassa]
MEMGVIPHIDAGDIGLGSSSDKGNAATPSTKPRKKTMTSVYLKFFETAQDGKSGRCKFCGQSYSIATATGNLGRHLGNRHPGYDKSGDVVVTSPSLQPITVMRKHQPQSQSQAKATQLDYEHLNWLLVKWLALASFPPSTLDEKWLTNSFKFLNPSIQLWPSEDYKKIFRDVFRSMQEVVRASLDNVSSKAMLDVCHIPFPCGVVEIYSSLVKVLRLYNIESRILSCTHDNSQSALQDLDGQNVGHFCYIPCSVHTLSLIIDDGLRTIERVIAKIREFALSLNASSEISDEFTQLTAAYHEGTWKIPLDTSTRWSGNYQMLDIVYKASKSMDAVIRKYETLGSRMELASSADNHNSSTGSEKKQRLIETQQGPGTNPT